MSPTLVDAGPLVALLDRRDSHHAACREALRRLPAPLMTVWPALTEAMYLLATSWPAQRQLLGWLGSGAIRLLSLDEADVPRIRELMAKYRDLPMDLADAALVRAAERDRITQIFTVDRRDFSLYRPARLGRFRIVP